MARFPKIDSPCPLGSDEQRRIAGYCGRCEKTVYDLDAMTSDQRSDLMMSATEALCVSYRTPSRRASSLVAIAATLVAGGAFAGEPAATPMALQPVATAHVQSTVEPVALAPDADSLELIFVGGVSDPRNAEWIDDSGLPDLPMVDASQRSTPAPSSHTSANDAASGATGYGELD